jgi:uncharacterized protein YqjF (DUF2071 family)
MEPEPVTEVPPRRVRPVVLRQRWRDVAFLHWPLDPARAAPLLPPGTRPDLLDGRTFVGVVALEMAHTQVFAGPALPWVGTFGQVNVRLYSVDGRGRRGVVFLELHADRLLPALVARSLGGLPYAWHRVRIERDGERRGYTVGPLAGAAEAHIEVSVGRPWEPNALERFVTDRWGLHTRIAGRTVYAGIDHGPWRLQAAEVLDPGGNLLAAAGLREVVGPPESVLWSPGMDAVRIGPAVR